MFADDDAFIMKNKSSQSFFYQTLNSQVDIKVRRQTTLSAETPRSAAQRAQRQAFVFTALRLTWGECFPVDWTSQRPNLRPSSGCPCPRLCPRCPLRTEKKKQPAFLWRSASLSARHHFLRNHRQRPSSMLPRQQTDGEHRGGSQALTWLSLLLVASTSNMICPASWGEGGRGGLRVQTGQTKMWKFAPIKNHNRKQSEGSD